MFQGFIRHRCLPLLWVMFWNAILRYLWNVVSYFWNATLHASILGMNQGGDVVQNCLFTLPCRCWMIHHHVIQFFTILWCYIFSSNNNCYVTSSPQPVSLHPLSWSTSMSYLCNLHLPVPVMFTCSRYPNPSLDLAPSSVVSWRTFSTYHHSFSVN